MKNIWRDNRFTELKLGIKLYPIREDIYLKYDIILDYLDNVKWEESVNTLEEKNSVIDGLELFKTMLLTHRSNNEILDEIIYHKIEELFHKVEWNVIGDLELERKIWIEHELRFLKKEFKETYPIGEDSHLDSDDLSSYNSLYDKIELLQNILFKLYDVCYWNEEGV